MRYGALRHVKLSDARIELPDARNHFAHKSLKLILTFKIISLVCVKPFAIIVEASCLQKSTICFMLQNYKKK